MKTWLASEVISKGGRSGTLHAPDGLLDITLGNPLEEGLETRGPNPETLFAGAYSACYHGAIENAAERLLIPITDPTVRAVVSLIEEDNGGYRLEGELHALLPGVESERARAAMEEAHVTCPYPQVMHAAGKGWRMATRGTSVPIH